MTNRYIHKRFYKYTNMLISSFFSQKLRPARWCHCERRLPDANKVQATEKYVSSHGCLKILVIFPMAGSFLGQCQKTMGKLQ